MTLRRSKSLNHKTSAEPKIIPTNPGNLPQVAREFTQIEAIAAIRVAPFFPGAKASWRETLAPLHGIVLQINLSVRLKTCRFCQGSREKRPDNRHFPQLPFLKS
jgi:hypothetical protein